MPGVIIDGQPVEIRGLVTQSWLDTPVLRLKIGEDGRIRQTRWIRGIVIHTTKGIPGGKDLRPQKILPGKGPDLNAEERVARYWSQSGRQAGAHLVVDFDGSVGCTADLQNEVTYHAGRVNEVTIGIEIFQGTDAEMYEEQLEAVVTLVDFLTARFSIQRQIQRPYHGGPIPRLTKGATDVVGVYGHRDVSSNRGEGDPGSVIFDRLEAAGYEPVDFKKGSDKTLWVSRQKELNDEGAGLKVDGIPGPATIRAIQSEGVPSGLWDLRNPEVPMYLIRKAMLDV